MKCIYEESIKGMIMAEESLLCPIPCPSLIHMSMQAGLKGQITMLRKDDCERMKYMQDVKRK